MFEEYNKPKSIYYVVEKDGIVVGSAGIAPLANEAVSICELQKMYFLPELRGRGLAQKLLEHCFEFARLYQFKSCYLETTVHYLKPFSCTKNLVLCRLINLKAILDIVQPVKSGCLKPFNSCYLAHTKLINMNHLIVTNSSAEVG